MRSVLSLFYVLVMVSASAQTYFPPTIGNEWESLSIDELNWCPEKVDSLFSFLEESNTKAFMVLKDGRIIVEEYFGTFTEDSLWYWASAGKTITATLTGKAMESGLLNLDDPVSSYLGEGWTSCDTEEELTRTIHHQLSMSSSFNNNPFLWDCTSPSCFQCTDLEVGTQWHYHNGVYRKLIEVVEAATGVDRNSYTNEVIESITGMSGFWFENLYISKHRDMARFGLLALNDFVWDGTPVLTDQEYIEKLRTPSQSMNPSYGYLWWLNGQESHMFPLDPSSYEGSMIPSGPDDMYMALGANDQKIYVVPSQNLVVTRQGNEAFESVFAGSSFDEELWSKISNLECEPLGNTSDFKDEFPGIFPNPSIGNPNLPILNGYSYSIYSLDGRKLYQDLVNSQNLNLTPGVYLISVLKDGNEILKHRHIVQ